MLKVGDLENKMVSTQEDLEEAARQWEEQLGAQTCIQKHTPQIWSRFESATAHELHMTWQTFQTLRRSALEADRDEYKRLYEKCLGE